MVLIAGHLLRPAFFCEKGLKNTCKAPSSVRGPPAGGAYGPFASFHPFLRHSHLFYALLPSPSLYSVLRIASLEILLAVLQGDALLYEQGQRIEGEGRGFCCRLLRSASL